MTLRLSRLVPDGYEKWYYDGLLGLLLYNDPERGWLAVTNLEVAENELDELQEALDSIEEFNSPNEVLPIPDDYEHAEPPTWEND